MGKHLRRFPFLLGAALGLLLTGVLGIAWVAVASGAGGTGASGVVLYSGADATLTGSCVVDGSVAGQASAAAYINGKLTTSGTANLSKTTLYVGAKGATVPPLSSLMPPDLVNSLITSSKAAQPSVPPTYQNGLTLSSGKTFTGAITVNGNLVISGSGTYSFASVYVKGSVTISGSANVSFAALNVQGSLTASGSGSLSWGPTYVAGDVTLSGSGQRNFTLLVLGGGLNISGSQNIGGDGTGSNPKAAAILVVGSSKAITYSGSGTLYGLVYNQFGGFTQTGSGTIRGSVLCGGSYQASGSSTLKYVQPPLDTTPPVISISSPANGSTLNTHTPTLTYSAGDSSTVVVKVDGVVVAKVSGNSLASLPDGSHTVTVTGTDAAGNSATATSTFTVDTTPPAVTNVTSTTANGAYGMGTSIPITVTFSEPVNVVGAPQLTLETGTTDRIATYSSGSGTASLIFNYTVQAGDTSADLDYVATTSLALNGGTIKDTAANPATLTLAAPGATHSLGANKNIVIETTPPVITDAPTDMTVEATSSAGATVNFGSLTSAKDAVNGTVAVIFSPVSGSTFAVGGTTVNYSATDAAGNTASGSFTITVESAAPPAVIDFYPATPHEGDLLILYGGGSTDPAGKVDGVTYKWTLSDGDGAHSPQDYEGIGQIVLLPHPGTYTVTLSVTDGTAAPSTSSQNITVSRSIAQINPLVTEVVAGQPTQVKARFLDPGWNEHHTAILAGSGVSVSDTSVAEDNAVGITSGVVTATVTATGSVGEEVNALLTLYDSDKGTAGSATLKLKIVGTADNPLSTDTREPNNNLDSRTPALKSGGAYLSYIQSQGDVDFFEIVDPYGNPLPYGTEVLATLSNLPADFDVAIFEDSGANTDGTQQLPLVGAPALSSSVLDTKVPWNLPFDTKVPWNLPFDTKVPWNLPFEAQAWLASPAGTTNPLDGYPLSKMGFTGLSTDDSSGTDLSFGELGFSYEGLFAQRPGLRVAAFSANRGAKDDVALATVQHSDSHMYVGIIGANGAYSTKPYTLALETSLPNALSQKSSDNSQHNPLVDPSSGSSDTQILYSSVSSNPKTIFVTQRERFDKIYGAGSWDKLFQDHLKAACDNPLVQGEILSVPAHLYDELDQAPYRVDLANDIATKIRGIIQDKLGGAQYVVIVGGDKIVPYRRVSDQTTVGNERAYQYGSYLMSDTPLFASLAAGDLLTDDYYVDKVPIAYNGSSLYIPDISVSRLVETPADIAKAIDTFAAESGVLKSSTALVTGFSFFADGAQNVKSILNKAGLTSITADPSLIGENWTGSELRRALIGTPADIASINAHFSHFAGISADGYTKATAGTTIVPDDLLSSSDIAGAQNSSGDVFAGRLIFSMGCHVGYNVPNEDSTIVATRSGSAAQSGVDPSLDFAEAMLSQGGVLIGNTGFGYGDPDAIAESEAVVGNLAKEMTSGGKSIGQALAEAKREYFGALPAVTPYDQKASLELEMYGMPQYTLGSSGAGETTTTASVVQSPNSSAGVAVQALLRSPVTNTTVPELLALVNYSSKTATADPSFTLKVIDNGTTTEYSYGLSPVDAGGPGATSPQLRVRRTPMNQRLTIRRSQIVRSSPESSFRWLRMPPEQ